MDNLEKKNQIIENVKAVIAAPSCCSELRSIAEEWLNAVDTDTEKEMSAKLIAELEEDVCSLDDVLIFFESEQGAQILGAEAAAANAEAARKAKRSRRNSMYLSGLSGGSRHPGRQRIPGLNAAKKINRTTNGCG